MNAYRVTEKIEIGRPVTEVFEAWSSGPRFGQWFAPMAVRPPRVEMDFSEGGRYRIEMDLGLGGVHVTEGRFLEIVFSERIRMTWRCDAWNDPPSEVEVLFQDVGGSTVIVVNHTHIETESAQEGQRQGWSACLAGLKSLFSDEEEEGT